MGCVCPRTLNAIPRLSSCGERPTKGDDSHEQCMQPEGGGIESRCNPPSLLAKQRTLEGARRSMGMAGHQDRNPNGLLVGKASLCRLERGGDGAEAVVGGWQFHAHPTEGEEIVPLRAHVPTAPGVDRRRARHDWALRTSARASC